MFSIMTWMIYGIFVGAIAKSVVPGEENFGFLKTVALGVAGSYVGGAIMYLLGKYEELEPSGLFMGVAGAVVALVLYNKLNEKK